MYTFGFFISSLLKEGGEIDFEYKSLMNNKFAQDKVLVETDDYVLILDGIILNKKDLIRQYNNGEWYAVLKDMYLKYGNTFFDKLRGSFCGLLYDKNEHKIITFTDQLGTKFVYYFYNHNYLVCSTRISEIYSFLREKGIPYRLDNTGSYLLLSYGFMVGDRTLCNQIQTIPAGHYLLLESDDLKINQYYTLSNMGEDYNEDESIEIIDTAFRKAVKDEFEKDREYNYKHLVALSGGLDSRMTSWVAHDLGYTDQINFTFAQTGSLDQKVPQQITSDLGHEWLFKALDNGLWLYNIDEITKLTGGNVLYYGLSHSYSLYKLMNFDEVGMIHTGQLGDVVISSHTKEIDEKFKFGDGAYTKTYLDRLKSIEIPPFPNKEIGCFYFRYLPGTNNGNMSEYCFTEMYSPFYNLDFIEKCLKIPFKYRYNHYIYKKWIIEKYPQAANYKWTGLQAKITTPCITWSGREIPINRIPSLIYRGIKGSRGLYNKKSMNPIGYYLETNPKLKDYLFSFFEYASFIENDELREDVLMMKQSGNPFEIIEAVSLLAAIKLFYHQR